MQQEDAALKIQTKYRQFSAKQEVEEMRQDNAAVKIQAGYRGYVDRQKVKAVRGSKGLIGYIIILLIIANSEIESEIFLCT